MCLKERSTSIPWSLRKLSTKPPDVARRWFISGRVQGVGFRWFVLQHALELDLRGWVRNEDDGRVQVYAVGPPAKLDALAGRLHQGPRMAEVRGVEQQEASVQQLSSFHSH
jgi:acylphosphatase